MKELYTSVVGSHAWGMQRPDSDWDYWVIYQVPSVEFLLGRRHDRGHESRGVFKDGMPWDRSSFEIGHHINQLMKGNINHVVAVFGPTPDPIHRKAYFDTYSNYYGAKDGRPYDGVSNPEGVHGLHKMVLKKIVSKNPAKNIYNSVNGLTTANLKKYFTTRMNGHSSTYAWGEREVYESGIGAHMTLEEWMATRAKKLGQIRRMVKFGFRVLTTGNYEFRSVPIGDGGYEDEQNVRQWQADLEKAYHASDLPDRPDPQPFEEWLIELRMGYLEHEE